MRILILTSIYPGPGRETAASFNRLQFRAFADAGHQVTVVAPVAWTDALRNRLAGRTTPTRYHVEGGIEVIHPTYFYTPKMLRHLYGHFYLASVRAAVRRAIKHGRPDVVYGCFVYPDGWAAIRLAREAGLPVVLEAIGSDILVASREMESRRKRVVEAVRAADAIVAVSRDLSHHIVALGADPSKVFVVHTGIDRNVFHPGDNGAARTRLGLPDDQSIILFVGNILHSKGAGILVEACALLAASGQEFTCYVVGRGRDERRVRSRVESLGLAGRVVLTGPRPHHELADWYRACDVVTLPSFSEGIPNVLREASACGRPYVATNVGGIPEITGPGSGLLVEPGDPRALADALRTILTQTPAGPASVSCMTAPTWEESAGQLATHLRDVVMAARVSAPDRGLMPTTAGAFAPPSLEPPR